MLMDSILGRVLEFEGLLGITVQPHKMTPDEAVGYDGGIWL